MSGFDSNPYGQNYATGGGAGGGFMSGSQDSPGGARRAATSTLRPVTIRQINNAQQSHADAEPELDGQELGQLTFVGVIRNVSKHTTNVSYQIEDGTGTIDVRQWLDAASDDTGKLTEIETNRYVRVLGQLKTFQGKRTLNSGHIRPITDFNEIYFHKLEAAYVHLQLTRGGSGGTQARGDSAAYSNGGDAFMTGAGESVDNPVQKKVLQAVKSLAETDSGEGVAIDTLVRKLTTLKREQIRSALDDLVGEGYLYSAEDEDHVLPT